MNTVDVRCPECDKLLMKGNEIKCPRCKNIVMVTPGFGITRESIKDIIRDLLDEREKSVN